MQSAELAADRLERAQRSVAEGESQIHDQRDLVVRLEEAGDDATIARGLLDILLKRQIEQLANLAAHMREFSLLLTTSGVPLQAEPSQHISAHQRRRVGVTAKEEIVIARDQYRRR
jgi:CRISPR/Cas system-associated endoribonuclease Cas2